MVFTFLLKVLAEAAAPVKSFMAKDHKPVKGSRAFWPRKRAARMYPVVRPMQTGGEHIKPLAFAGYKAGMTQISVTDTRKQSATSGREVIRAATVIDCPPLVVCGIKLYRSDNGSLVSEGTIWQEKLPNVLSRKLHIPKKPHMKKELAGKNLDRLAEVRLIVSTQPGESGIGKKTPEVFEIPVSGDVEKQWAYALEKLGKELMPAEVFAQGEMVDIKAVTKGKGYAGVIKRFGLKIRSRKSGGKMRHLGTMGPVTPSRVLPGKIAQAGQLGFQTRTEFNKRILKIGDDGISPKGGFVSYGQVPKGYMLIQGSIPGPKKRLIILRKAARWSGKPQHVDLKYVSLEPQQ